VKMAAVASNARQTAARRELRFSSVFLIHTRYHNEGPMQALSPFFLGVFSLVVSAYPIKG
jgi:hypothetical protein